MAQAAASPGARQVPPGLNLRTSTHRHRTVVLQHGPLELSTCVHLRGELIELISSGRHHLILDLDGVEILDSTGLAVLVTALHRLRGRGGSLVLVCSRAAVLRPLRITGLAEAFTIHATLGAALEPA